MIFYFLFLNRKLSYVETVQLEVLHGHTELFLLEFFVAILARAGPSSCRIGLIHFLARWHKKAPKPDFNVIVFSFVCVFRFWLCNFVTDRYGLNPSFAPVT